MLIEKLTIFCTLIAAETTEKPVHNFVALGKNRDERAKRFLLRAIVRRGEKFSRGSEDEGDGEK